MTRAWLRQVHFAVATLCAMACLPATANAVVIDDVFDFKGTVTDIGVQRGPGQVGGIEYRIEGKFDYGSVIDLTKTTLTFHNLFDEYLPGGNGEMVLTIDNADLVCPEPPDGCVPALAPLPADSSSRSFEAKYVTPGRFRPQMRVIIKYRNGHYEFNVRLDRGLSPQVPPGDPEGRQFPRLCAVDPASNSQRPTTQIRTAFTIDNHVNEPIVLDFVKAWECADPGRYHLRSR